jgi:hypothetical protein
MGKKAGENYGETVKDVNDAAKDVGAMTNRMDTIQDTLRDFRAGGWASKRESIAQFMRGVFNTLGTTKEVQDKMIGQVMNAPGEKSLAAQQVFRAMINQYAIAQLKEVAQGTGRVMKSEVDAFMRGLSENMEPGAIMDYINRQGRPIVQMAYDKVQHFPEFDALVKAKRENPGNFESWYLTNKQTTRDRLPTVTKQGVPIGPRPVSEALGGPKPEQPAVMVDPQTGRLVPVQPQQSQAR